MKRFLPRKLEPVVFGLLLAGMMTFFVSGISTVIAVGMSDASIFGKWMKAWFITWAFAFPIVLFVGPVVRRIVNSIVIAEKPE